VGINGVDQDISVIREISAISGSGAAHTSVPAMMTQFTKCDILVLPQLNQAVSRINHGKIS